MQEEDEDDYCRTIDEQVRACLLSARVFPPLPFSPALNVDQEQCTLDTRYCVKPHLPALCPPFFAARRPLSLFVAYSKPIVEERCSMRAKAHAIA